MTHDFDRVRQSAHTSALATAGRRAITVTAAAWSSSAVGGWWTDTRDAFARATPPRRLRWWAITIAVACATHLVLRPLMSSTVAPAMPPGLYILIAASGAVIAWQAEAFHRAWLGSSVRGLGSWVMGKSQDSRPKSQDSHDRN